MFNSNCIRRKVALSLLLAGICVLAGSNTSLVIRAAYAGGSVAKPALNFSIPSAPIVPSSGDLGYLPGLSHVGVDGSQNYTIPIEAPAGLMMPHLALRYSSRVGNGLLGVGWSLSGLSSITRCRQTLSTEGAVNGVHMTDFSTTPEAQRDRFCLDGKKLIAIQGSYGADNTEYRTEEDSYQRIVSHSTSAGSATQGPDSFTVVNPNGQVSRYSGQLLQRTAENVSQASGAGSVQAVWMLANESDTVGNGVVYSYNTVYGVADSEGVQGQQVVLTQITYTTHNGDAQLALRNVKFGYDENLSDATGRAIAHRPDQEIAWQAGVKTQLVKLLTSITMSAPDPVTSLPVWKYAITYQAGGSSFSSRSLLHSVQRCALNGSASAPGGCTWSRSFGYTAASSSPTFSDASLPSATNTAIAPVPAPQPGNVNGTAFYDAPVVSFFGPMPYIKVLDANGDGVDDMLFQPGQTLAWSAQAAAYSDARDPNDPCHAANNCAIAPSAIAPQLLIGTRSSAFPYAVSPLAQSYDLSGVAGGDLWAYNNSTPPPISYDGSLGYYPWGALENLAPVDIDGSGRSAIFMAAPIGANGCSYRMLDWGSYLNGLGVGFSDRGTDWSVGNGFGCINWAAQAQWLAAIPPTRNFLFLDADGDNRPDLASYVANLPSGNGYLGGSSDVQLALNLGANTLTPVSAPTVGGGGVSANCPFYGEDFYGDGRSGLFGQTYSAAGCGASEIFYYSPLTKWMLTTDGVDVPKTQMPDLTTTPKYSTPQEYYGDFNGDGLQDVITIENVASTGTWPVIPQLRWNTGNGFGPPHPVSLGHLNEIGEVNAKVIVADINGDGRDDLVIFHEDCMGVRYSSYSTPPAGVGSLSGCVASNFVRAITLMLSNGDGTFNQVDIKPVNAAAPADPGVLTPEGWTTSVVGDFNGDGRLDIARVVGGAPQNTLLVNGSACIGQVVNMPDGSSPCSASVSSSYQITSGTLQILTQNMPSSPTLGDIGAPDIMSTVTDEGAKTNRELITYSNQWWDKPTDPTIACNGISYPQRCLAKGLVVVRNVFSTDTRADTASSIVHAVHYSYKGPAMDARGRGFLGFHEVEVWDPTRLQQTITVYDNFHETGTLLPSPTPASPPPSGYSYSYTPALFQPGYYPGTERPLSVTTVTAIPTDGAQSKPVLLSDGVSPAINARVVQTVYNNQLVTGAALEANNPLVYAIWPVANATTPAQMTWEWEQPVSMAANVTGSAVPYTDYLWGSNCLLLADPSDTNPAVKSCVPPSTAVVRTVAIPSGGIDAYGNITSQITQTATNGGATLGEEIVTTSTYNNLTTPTWLIGQLTSRSVIAIEADPSVTSVRRRVAYDYDANGLLKDEYTCQQAAATGQTPCGNFALVSTKTLTRDSYGNITSVANIARGPDATTNTRQVNIEYDNLWQPGQPSERIFPSQYWVPVSVPYCSQYDKAGTCLTMPSWTPSNGVLIHPAYGVVVASNNVATAGQSNTQYDDQGRPVTFIPAVGASTSIGYQARTDRSSLADIDGMIVTSTTLATGTAAGQIQTVSTDSDGRAIQSTHLGFDGSAITDSYVQYDLLGRPVATFRPYAGSGVPAPGSYYATTVYDGLNRVLCRAVPDPVGGNANAACKLPSAASPWSTTTYGYYFNAATDIYPVPSPVFSRPVSSVISTDPNGNVSRSDTDLDARTIATATTDPGSPGWVNTYFHYAAFGQVDRVITPLKTGQSVETTVYDTLGRVIENDSPDTNKIVNVVYDGYGEMLSSTHWPSNAVESYQYDSLGRQTRWSTCDPSVAAPTPNPNPSCAGLTTGATFVYDSNGLGQLATATSSDNVKTALRYDSYGRPVGTDETIAGHTYSIGQVYNGLGQIVEVDYPGIGSNTTPWISLLNGYNESGYSNEVDYFENGNLSSKQPIWRVYTRDQNDALTTATFGNTAKRPGILGKPATLNQLSVNIQNSYFPQNGQPQRLVATPDTSGNPILDYSYRQLPNGMVQSRADAVNGRMETFQYDGLNRLTNWNLSLSGCTSTPPCAAPTSAAPWQQYSYDPAGNLLQVMQVQNNVMSPLQTNSYGGQGGPHALTAQIAGGTSVAYSYDAQGRQVSGGNRSTVYNARNLPRTVTYNGNTYGYLYDAFGRRALKTWPDNTTMTAYVGGLYEQRISSAGALDVYYVPGGQLEYNESNGAISEFGEFTDALGSVATVFNGSAGSIVTTGKPFFHEPFGAFITSGGAPTTPALGDVKESFTGQTYDEQLGLLDFKGRLYDPLLKRFPTPDAHVTFPRSGQSWNRYSYVLNNPLNMTDRTGFDPDPEAPCCAPGTEDDRLRAAPNPLIPSGTPPGETPGGTWSLAPFANANNEFRGGWTYTFRGETSDSSVTYVAGLVPHFDAPPPPAPGPTAATLVDPMTIPNNGGCPNGGCHSGDMPTGQPSEAEKNFAVAVGVAPVVIPTAYAAAVSGAWAVGAAPGLFKAAAVGGFLWGATQLKSDDPKYEDNMTGKVLAMVGGVAPVAQGINSTMNTVRQFPWQTFLNDQRGAIIFNNTLTPMLQPGNPGQMVREAAAILRVTPPDDRLRMGEHLLDQIVRNVNAQGLGKSWGYQTVSLGDGTTVFAGRAGGGLVVTPTSVRIVSGTEAANVFVTVPGPLGTPEIIGVLDE